MNMTKGNVLFLILLAVALFAALSYAVTQSSRSSGKNISDEQAKLFASKITQYGTNLKQVVTRLRLTNGCRDTQISFASDSDQDGEWYDTDDEYHNTNAPSNFSCHVFHPNGGNMHPLEVSPDWLDQSHSGYSVVYGKALYLDNRVYSKGTIIDHGTEANELVFTVGFLKQGICKHINDYEGLELWEESGKHNGNDSSRMDLFDGDYSSTEDISRWNLFPPLSGCFCDGVTTPCEPDYRHYYYHTLIVR